MNLSHTAETMMRLLAHCGAATLRQLANSPDPVSPRWVSEFAKKHGLVTVATTNYKGRSIRYVTLSADGRQYVREMLGIVPYLTRSVQLIHDFTLAGVYLRVEPEQRAAWQNPDELLARLKRKTRAKVAASYPDGLCQEGGKIVAIEIAGRKLTESQKELKRITAWATWDADVVIVEAGRYADDDF